MSELLQSVLTDPSLRKPAALRKRAARRAQLGYGWAGDAEV